jgi:type I restriction enzyme, S subunit
MLRITDIQNNAVDWSTVPYCEIPKSQIARYRLKQGDIVFARTGATVGKSFRIATPPPESVFASYLIRVGAPLEGISRYLAHFFRSPRYWEQVTDFSAGIGQPNVNGSKLRELEVTLAPLEEQQRIADKLDALFGQLDTCRERLNLVPGILERFRESILAAATSGELTREWRETRGVEEEKGSGLPRSWTERRIGDLGIVQLGRQRSPKFHSGKSMRPYLRVQNVFEDRLDLSDVMQMDFPPGDFRRYQLHSGDILLNEGQSPQFLGRPAMYRGELPGACFTNTLIRFQADKALVQAEYALLVFRHHMHSGRYASEGNITTNIAHLGARRFAAVEFPLPPLEEQAEIVLRAGALLNSATELELRVVAAVAQADRLTPAILAKAFRGELVGQDPNDEPAEVLLQRLRDSRPASA